MLKIPNYDNDSVTLINAIKASASAEYKSRVPDATQTNLATVGDSILSYQATRNEFLSSLIDRIALTLIKSATFNNPLKPFKGATVRYGKDIQDLFVDLINAQNFDSDKAETDLFKKHRPDVLSCFHTINRTEVYVVTVEDEILRRGFTSSESFQDLVQTIVSRFTTSNELDEFLQMKNIIHVAQKSGKIHNIVVDDVIDEASAKRFATQVKATSNKMMFLRTDYNHAGVKNNTPKERQVLLINPDYDAVIDVELLAQAFNMSKTDFEMRKIIVDDFGEDNGNTVAMLVDENWLIAHDTLSITDSQRNALGLYTNYYFHIHQILSSSVFPNAVAFVTTTPTLTSITLDPATATVPKGQSLQLNVKFVGTNSVSSKCKFTLTGNESSKTAINSLGLLVVGSDETATTLTVTATSTFDNTKTATVTITVA